MDKKKQDYSVSIIILIIAFSIIISLMFINRNNDKKDIDLSKTTVTTTDKIKKDEEDEKLKHYSYDMIGKTYKLDNGRSFKIYVKKDHIEISVDNKLICKENRKDLIELDTLEDNILYYCHKDNTLYIIDKNMNIKKISEKEDFYLEGYTISKTNLTLNYSKIKDNKLDDIDLCEENEINKDTIVKEIYSASYESDFEELELIDQISLIEIEIDKICEK